MQRKFWGIIIVDYEVTIQLLTILSAFVKKLRKKLEQIKAIPQLFLYLKKDYQSARKEMLYNILIQLGTPMKLVGLIEMCLNETHRVPLGKHLTDTVPVKKGLKNEMTCCDFFSTFLRICH
jgi:hypothetical protein